jgi:hypothetical protein
MCTPPAFREDDPDVLRAMIHDARLCKAGTHDTLPRALADIGKVYGVT